MTRRQLGLRIAVVSLAVASCSGSATDAPVDEATGTLANNDAPAADGTAPTSTAQSPGRTPATTRPYSPESDVPMATPPAETGVFRVAPAGRAPLALRFGPDGLWAHGHTPAESKVLEGPVSESADAYPYALVFQRPGINNRIFTAVDGQDKELLVATGAQTLELLGVQFVDDRTLVMYQRRTPGNPESTSETLRAYDMETKEVVEIAVTGGWESGTQFSHINDDRAAGLWSAEAFHGVNIIDTVSGDIVSGGAFECLIGEFAPGCTQYDEAVAIDTDVYGYGPVVGPDLNTEGYALYRLDTVTGNEEIVASWSYGWETLYQAQGMYLEGTTVVISLKDEEGQPLPALLVDVQSGESWTAPKAGFLRPAYVS